VIFIWGYLRDLRLKLLAERACFFHPIVKKCYQTRNSIPFILYLPMLKSLLIFTCCIFATATGLRAQTIFSGRVLENKTHIKLHGVRIENLSTHLKTLSGEAGEFSIAAKTGDLIVFRNFSYQPDTLLLTDMHEREVLLTPQSTMLNQVNITDTSGRSSVADKNAKLPYDPQFHGQTAVYHRDGNGNYVGGVDFRLHYFTKDDHDKRKAAQKEKDRETVDQIISVFTEANLSQYVPLKGDDMVDFILLYLPDVKVYQSKDFNLLSYLNACYKTWQTLTPGERKAGRLFKN